MSTPAGEGCDTCRFCHAATAGEGELRLVCRRYPPTVSAFLLPSSKPPGYEVASNMAWPVVEREHWCGEYRQNNTRN